MKRLLLGISACMLAACGPKYSEETVKNDLRAPAYPLLTLHPHVNIWSAADRLTDRHPTFAEGKELPFNGLLRVDSTLYLFMGSPEVPPMALAPMGGDGEQWEAKMTTLRPDEGWEQPSFDDRRWNVREGAFGKAGEKGVKSQWLAPDLWLRREVAVDPAALEHRRVYVRYSHKGAFRLWLNGRLLVDRGAGEAVNAVAEVPKELVETMKGGKALLAAHCRKTEESTLADFGLFAEEPAFRPEAVSPMAETAAWTARYTTDDPGAGWEQPTFDDTAWAEGAGAFGTEGMPDVRTPWNKKRLWVRRRVRFDPALLQRKALYAEFSHNDGMELYVNGMRIAKTGNKAQNRVQVEIPDSVAETMKDGTALLAARCVNWGGAGLADFGLYARTKQAEQLAAEVQPTQTHYRFRCGEVELQLTFTDPRLPDEVERMAQPVNYITYRAKALDGQPHDVAIYFETDPHRSFRAGQSTELYMHNGLAVMRTGRENQELWTDKEQDAPGWGYFYLAANGEETSCAQGDAAGMRLHFLKHGTLEGMRESAAQWHTAFAQRLDAESGQPGHLTAAFNGLYAMSYFGENLRPYWNRDGKRSAEELLRDAERGYRDAMARCYAYDRRLMEEATRAGGREYAGLCALAFRQTLSAFQLAESPEGELLCFTNHVGPVEVYYAASPLFLYANPELLEAMLNPFFYYSESGRWKKPFPPRKIEGYPYVNGVKRGDDWPVEEAGNALLMTAALTRATGDGEYAEHHWETLTAWADYLREHGMDTGRQADADALVRKTAPRHANLSLKAVLAVAAYAQLAELLGKQDAAENYRQAAEEMAAEWTELAGTGDHTRLAFGQPDESWGLKYNLVWDDLLGLRLFPEEMKRQEAAFYAEKTKAYGVPLESGTHLARAEWALWAAMLAGDAETAARLTEPLYRYMNEAESRVPMPDTYDAGSAKWAKQANRPAVGGCFIRLAGERLKKQ